ncbi:hypothetical protein [Streptomyces swartbergensis]|uniref:hypothetical protein n=1 Tax=Streptomyces swartbergensis TaxID=487165 RepID=UPI00381CC9AB
MPEPDLTAALRKISDARASLTSLDRKLEKLRSTRADLAAKRESLRGSGDVNRADKLDKRIELLDSELLTRRDARDALVHDIAEISGGLVARFPHEELVATLDGRHPVAMLPVRIETRFDTPTRLRIRVFPDQLHIDAHEPALTSDEREAARWYWKERWAAGLDDTAVAANAWQQLTQRFRPGRAAYFVKAMTPANTPPDGDPQFPELPTRASSWGRPPQATALPDRFCVVGLGRQDGQWVERFREWGRHVPDRLPVGMDPAEVKPAPIKGALPADEGTRWLREPKQAKEQGVLIEVSHPSLATGVERLVVLGVDWTQSPQQAADSLNALLEAQRYAGHLAFVPQGTPTNNTSEGRSGWTSDADAAAAALDPSAPVAAGDKWSAGPRLAHALGLGPAVFAGLPGAELREHAWASALTDVLWRSTAGHYLADMLDPLAEDPQLDVDLREFMRLNVFACGPLPTLRVGAQPYGVLPVVSSKRFDPGPDQAAKVVRRVATLMRDIVSPSIADVPHLRRAGEDQDVDATLLALLQRTPVPWTFRFRALTGPVQRSNVSVRWDLANTWQRTWTTAMWVGLGVFRLARISELTHGKDHPLPVPLVRKPGEPEPTGYLTEIAELAQDPYGRTALNLRANSLTLLEALAACSAVLEVDRCGLLTTIDKLQLRPEALEKLAALRKHAVPTPDMLRVEAPPLVAPSLLDFRSGRQLADTVVPQVSDLPLGQYVTLEFAEKVSGGLAGLLNVPTDPFHWLARNHEALQTLAQAPPDQLEWAFRGHLDLYATRLDAWLTGLATRRLADHRAAAPTGVHVGCWGFVENLRHDAGSAAESLGFVHTPSLAHAVSTALLRNGRLANRGDDGKVFDLQVTSDRVRRGQWLLDGVAQGQRLAALLGYRLERTLREAGLEMMRYQMPLRRTAPLRGPDVRPDTSVEVLTARDVVDGVALLDRWREDSAAVLADVAAQAKLSTLPGGDATRLRAVIDEVNDAYDAVSDLLVAESVHQASLGNLDRSGAALSAHDRHGRAPELDYIASPQSGHTVSHRVAVVLQDPALGDGWPRDARGAAEPLLDAWVAGVLGDPAQWQFGALLRANGTTTVLSPVSAADLGLGPLSLAMAAQRPGEGRPSELEQRVALTFAAQSVADPAAELELHPDPPGAAAAGGLALLVTLGEWVAKVAAAAPLTAGDFVSGADVRPGMSSPGSADTAELADRVAATRSRLGAAITALTGASDNDSRAEALLGAAAFAGPDALPRVPANHRDAARELGVQVAETAARLTALAQTVDTALDEPPPTEASQLVDHQAGLLRSMLGPAQPVLPRWSLAEHAAVAGSLGARDALLAGDPTAPAAWLHRSALVRPELDALAGLLLHAEAAGADVSGQLHVVQLPHRPDAPWHALPFRTAGPPPHGSLGLVAHTWQPFNPARSFAGVVVDAWTETIPAGAETTALTFHYDAPGARAPQAVLLAVHPARRPQKWSFDVLLDTVNEAADLAQLRTLSAKELAPMGSFLPALYLPDDYTRDVPSVSLKELVTSAATGMTVTNVLGKA